MRIATYSSIALIGALAGFFLSGSSFSEDEKLCTGEHDKKLRENLSEKQIDDMVACSFPASDPPSTY